MATEYKLPYTGSEVAEKLGKVDELEKGINQLSSEKVSKNNVDLRLHIDGLFHIFIDGTPVGNGIALPGTSG